MKKNLAAARIVAAAAVVGLSSGLAMPVVMAQTTETQEAAPPVVDSTVVDSGAKGSLTIHKRANPDTTGTPTGEFDPEVGGDPLPEVGFTIYKIDNVNLGTNEGLAAAAGLTPGQFLKASEVPGEGPEVTGATKVGEEQFTDVAGKIEYADLEIGAYLVVETSPKEGYNPAAPFIAFVPMTAGNAETGGTSWNYDVHAYPKNYSSTAVKEVEDSNMNAGDTIEFTITSDVPQLASADTTLSLYTVQDDLQENLITTSVENVAVRDFEAGDYVVTVDETQQVNVNFTEIGLRKLTDKKRENNDYQVVTTIKATVSAPTETSKLVNEATVISNNGSGGGDTTTKTNETVTYWGNVKIEKVDAKDNTKLSGAIFELFTPGVNGTCEAGDQNKDQRVTIKDKFQWETVEGVATIEGLHINDFEDNGVGQTADQAPVYCLFEVESPKGYELLAEPIELKLTKTGAEEADPEVYELTFKVKNLEDTTPNLPMTGGMGIGLLAGTGAVLLAAAAWFARRSSRS